MTSWIPYAFVRIVSFFIAGIYLGIYFPESLGETSAAYTLGALLFAYLVAYLFRSKPFGRFITGFIALPFVFICGYVSVLRNTDIRNVEHLAFQDSAETRQ